MIQKIRTAFFAIVLLTILLGFVYPMMIFAIGKTFFPHHANGALIQDKSNRIIGSQFIGQNFSSPQYFHPRPSHAGSLGYDAMASGGSNLGPTSKKLMDLIEKRIEIYRMENHLPANTPIPADAVTASGSGLDPHISVDNANLQAARVAEARTIPLDKIHQVIRKATTKRWMGVFGERSVNVLMLNLQLEELSQ